MYRYHHHHPATLPGAIAAFVLIIIVVIIYYCFKRCKNSNHGFNRGAVCTGAPGSYPNQSAQPVGVPLGTPGSIPYPVSPNQYPPGVYYSPGPVQYPEGAQPYPTYPQGNVMVNQYPQENGCSQTYPYSSQAVPVVGNNNFPLTASENLEPPSETKAYPAPMSANPYLTHPSYSTEKHSPELCSNPPYPATGSPSTIQHPPGVVTNLYAGTYTPHDNAVTPLGTNSYPSSYATIPWPTNATEDNHSSGNVILSPTNASLNSCPGKDAASHILPSPNTSLPTQTTEGTYRETGAMSFPSPYSTIPVSTSGSVNLALSTIFSVPKTEQINSTVASSQNSPVSKTTSESIGWSVK